MKKIPLWLRVMIGMVLGIAVGLFAGTEITQYFKPIGQLFINSIQMLVVPLILSTLICGVAGMSDPSSMGRIGGKVLLALVLFTAISSSIGLGTANLVFRTTSTKAIFKESSEKNQKNKNLVNLKISEVALDNLDKFNDDNPEVATKLKNILRGATINAELIIKENMLGDNDTIHDENDDSSLIGILKNIIPSNPIASMSKGNILQIIVFGILLGICIVLIKDKGAPLFDFFNSLADAMFAMVNIVMSIAPIGVFFLMAWVTSNFGIDTLEELAKVIVAVYIACILQGVVVYGIAITIAGLSAKRYFTGLIDVIIFAFATSSSAGTLPVALKCTEKNLGVPKSMTSFILPLCATINMSGTAIYEGVAAVFIAQMYGIDLSFTAYVIIVVTSIIAAVGSAGVPGGGLIMLSLILNSVGLPLEGIALIAGIDRILDMARTVLNVMGDAAIATIIAKSENKLDMDVYNRIENIEE